MKKILAWVKQNVLIVVFAAIIVLVLPAAFVVSAGWNSSIRKAQETRAGDKLKQVTGARVAYALPPAGPGLEGVSFQAAPNTAVTEWFRANKERIESQGKQLVAEAERFNRRDHAPLMDDIFPKPSDPNLTQVRALEFAEKIVGRPERGVVSAYQRLLDQLGAGGPGDAEKIAEQLKGLQARETERITGNNAQRQLTEEEQAQIRNTLVQSRLALYQQNARRLTFFATTDILDRSPEGVPAQIPPLPPSIAECFAWQWDYWVIADVLTALRNANVVNGQPTDLASAPLKRVISIRVQTPVPGVGVSAATGDPMGGEPVGPPPPIDASTTALTPEFIASPTGRGLPNTLYDNRVAIVEIVAASDRLPAILDAIASSNFHAVSDIDLYEVNVWDDLEAGFYYGGDHVVRCVLRIETAWLRSWTVPLMPEPIRTALGVPPDPETPPSDQPAPPQ